ncbi:acylneuraminate cytidylyltransferase family protein [Mucilaginibacter auburnensis]|uniref:N-acylneuraminate cytidylyltransferase n=1 Tax=Mucilaginibacter auburnensis TaxID=1457233 RepID=A0A2H9VTA6_9SPHI|nr:acylneuraminate cytidylyltransferase family protein [Mucilaginibacter auburnensis]PJJ84056.1 N-acylneuraminate cytidylyltransferase [Mucilaginibacter auburnensis]
MGIVFFLPTRKGSERVVNKNTKPFAGIEGGLLEVKLKQLIDVKNVDEIILSTNDPESIKVAEAINSSKVRIVQRPEHLCLSSTNLQDLINYVPEVTDAEHIFWVHVTSPLVLASDYEQAVDVYKEQLQNGYDSLVSVSKIQQFLWDEERMEYISHDSKKLKWPRTQDLKVFYELNSAMFINSRANYVEFKDRLGAKPYKFELGKIKSFDVDWVEDFEITEVLYQKFVL